MEIGGLGDLFSHWVIGGCGGVCTGLSGSGLVSGWAAALPARKGRSYAEFTAKVGVVAEEADEFG